MCAATCDFKIILQFVTMALCMITLLAIVWFRVKFGFISSIMWGVIVLLSHLAFFYTTLVLRDMGAFDFIVWLKSLYSCDLFSYTLWSAAIGLQVVVELALMTLTVFRRNRWISPALK